MTATPRPTIVVVGAGIAGLAAAWELAINANAGNRSAPEIHIVESAGRVGGKLQAAHFAGRTVDVAADAFLARRPEATELCSELGLTEHLVPIGASGASLWARDRLRTMPEGLYLGIPTRWWPLFRSGILSVSESLRVAKDLVAPHPDASTPSSDQSIAAIVEARLGRPVVDRLVDPLIGGINAGGVDSLSAAATFPILLAANQRGGSLMRGLGRMRPAPQPSAASEANPVFWSLGESTATLADELARRLIERGVTIHTRTTVVAIDRVGGGDQGQGGWHLALAPSRGGVGPTRSIDADGVIVAVPATGASVLLAPWAPAAASVLDAISYASVAVITFSVPEAAIGATMTGTGFLVPRTSSVSGRPALITGCTYLGRKWPHLARAGDELIRVSVGRFGDARHQAMDDAELAAASFGELAELLRIQGAPYDSLVTRWDDAFPQYAVGHLANVASVDQELAGLGGVAVAGAAYRGVGIPACIGSGRAAARRVLASIWSSGEPEPTQ